MNQTYNELTITPPNYYYELFLDLVTSLFDEAIEEKDGSIILRSEEDLSEINFGVQEFAKSLQTLFNKDILLKTSSKVCKNEDWIGTYKKSIQPIEVGDLYIHPSWEKPKANKINVLIDPALAFGSGHHETTYGCLLMLQKYLNKQATLLDVGCGSGILSIAAAKLGAKVSLCDTDEQALQSALENFSSNTVTCERSWVGSVGKREKAYDVVVANIIADVLIMLQTDLESALKDGGILILSGILDKYATRVVEKYKNLILIEKYKKDEWFTLVLKKEVNESEQQSK
ncbi:MAG: 50S ribosomal protein L11 methyltransferase [Sulfurospirillum sp.]|nr:50S ribosomal protein L11 methyltransferase [Sulfurospirillum sp.]